MQAHIFLSGHVQGVFLRDNTKKKAISLGLTGWVKNLSDGRVEVVLVGSKNVILEILAWFKKGAPGSVSKMDVSWSKDGEFSGFEIVY